MAPMGNCHKTITFAFDFSSKNVGGAHEDLRHNRKSQDRAAQSNVEDHPSS